MTEAKEAALDLTNSQKKVLRGLGHHLEPIVQVGKEGLSAALLKSLEAALKAHELVKIKLGQNCPLERDEAGMELSRLTNSFLVQVIGRTLLLYRPNPDIPKDKRISL